MSTLMETLGIDLGIVVLILLVMVVILMFMTANLAMGIRRLNRKYKTFMKGKDGQSLEKQFQNKFRDLDRLAKLQDKQYYELEKISGVMERTLNKYGIVKYDAFDDVGGKMSFALAMLDKNNTGFILNAIHSRENCFLYMKEIVKGESYIMLSEEEIQALKRAVSFSGEEEI